MLQEAVPVVLPGDLLLCLREFLHQRLLLFLDLGEPRQIEISDLVPGDLEHLADDPVGYVRPVVSGLHQLAELDFDDVVDHLLGEHLHL